MPVRHTNQNISSRTPTHMMNSRVLSSINLLGNQTSPELAQGLIKIMESHKNLTTLCGIQRNEAELNLSNKNLGAGCAVLLSSELQHNTWAAIISMLILPTYNPFVQQVIDQVGYFWESHSRCLHLGSKLGQQSGGNRDIRRLGTAGLFNVDVTPERAQYLEQLFESRRVPNPSPGHQGQHGSIQAHVQRWRRRLLAFKLKVRCDH